MSEKKQNLNFATPNKDQQKIFQDYLGKKLGTKALLVLEQLDKKTRELNYTFVYQYPERLVLASFELTLDKDNKLKSFGSNLLIDGANSYKINIEDLILNYVKKSIEDTDVEEIRLGSSMPAIELDEFLDDSSAAAEDYSTKSQATYFFDCDGKGINADGKINPNSSKGSFCCVLERKKYQEKAVDNKKWLVNVDDDTDKILYDSKQDKDNAKSKLDEMAYYILTAWHNLKNSTEIGTNYFLKGPSEIKLELRKYSEENDYAILKIFDDKIIPSTIQATVDTDFVQKVVKAPKKEEAPKDGNLVAYQYCIKPIKGLKYINRGDDGKFAISDGERGKSGGAIVYNDRVMGMYQNVSDGEKQAITLKYILDDVNEGKTDKYKPA